MITIRELESLCWERRGLICHRIRFRGRGIGNISCCSPTDIITVFVDNKKFEGDNPYRFPLASLIPVKVSYSLSPNIVSSVCRTYQIHSHLVCLASHWFSGPKWLSHT
jgi:hypothetical protein